MSGLDDLFNQAAGDASKFPGSRITVQASATTNRWGAGLGNPSGYDNLLVVQSATGGLTYSPQSVYETKLGEIIQPASFSGQVSSGPFQADDWGKLVSYAYSLSLSIFAATPFAPNSVVATLTQPVRRPSPTQSYSNVFSIGTSSNVAFNASNLEASPPQFLFVQLSDYAVAKPPKFSPIVPGLLGVIFGGIEVDGGGTVVVGGAPGPVPPWGPIPAAVDPATYDVLIGITLDQIARYISDPQISAAVRSAILSGMSRSVGLIAESVSEGPKHEGVMKTAAAAKGGT